MKREIDYAYAVARVRANELKLLSESDIDQLIAAEDYKTTMHRLSDAGWGDCEGYGETRYAEYLENNFNEAWDLLVEILGEDIHDLDLLLIKNDMQNLKAALKGIVSQHGSKDLYAKSTVYDDEKIIKFVDERKFEELPEFMQSPAKEAYDVLTSTSNGQLADAIIDKATLEQIELLGKKSGCKVLKTLSERMVATACIKTALRCANTNKAESFMERSIPECSSISKKELISAALSGEDEILAYLEKTPYSEGAEEWKKSTSAFEKWCDDILMDCVSDGKFTPFGLDPIVAYYIAKDAEIKTVRIILSAKINNLPAELIRERVRALYV